MLANDTDCALCNPQQRAQPPLAGCRWETGGGFNHLSTLAVDNLLWSLDITATRKCVMIMTTAKAKAREPKGKTAGTVMAEKLRAQANGISDAEREKLLQEGLAMIYGGC